MKLWTPEEDLREFYQRSVADRRSTGVPGPFEVLSDGQQWDTKPIIYPGVTKAVASVQDGAFLAPPVIDSFYPYWGKDTGGNTIDIYGSNFLNTATVRFGGVNSVGGTFFSSTHIQAVTPSRSYSGDISGVAVEVSNVNPFDSGLSDSLSTFTYEKQPGRIDEISGVSGMNHGQIYTLTLEMISANTGGQYFGYIGYVLVQVESGATSSYVGVSYISSNPVFVGANGLVSFQIIPTNSSSPNSIGTLTLRFTDQNFGNYSNSIGYGVQ